LPESRQSGKKKGKMKEKAYLRSLIEKHILILDGAMGTELKKQGLPAGVCPEAWSVKNPEVVAAVYRDYVEAGADIIYTATFGGNAFKLAEYGEKDVVGINRALAALAKKAAGDRALVAGDIAPFGRFVEPFGEIGFEEAVRAVKLQVQGLLEGGVDLFMIETMMDIQEARAALIAVKETCPAFTIVTMTYEKDGHTLNGTDPVAALITLQSLGADAVGCNCSSGPQEMIPLIKKMKPFAKVPLVAKPNAGLPRLVGGKTVFDMEAEEFGSFGEDFRNAGANLLGGCCGTSPLHIRSLASRLKGRPGIQPARASIGAVSSSRKALVFTDNGPLVIIGERINPTGKKTLQEALLKNDFSFVHRLAREQLEKGATLLDINVGHPGVAEAETLARIVQLLSLKVDAPLVLDSAKISAFETALRVYPGRALINSLSGEKEKLQQLLPRAAFYGAMCIVLPLTGKVLPATLEERIPLINGILKEAERFGYTRDDLIVDGLVMALSSKPSAVSETLKTIAYCKRELGMKTLIGLSNVSFGMPARKQINAAFLIQASHEGLTCAIANPNEKSVMDAKVVSDLLRGSDPRSKQFIDYYRENPDENGPRPTGDASADPGQEVERAILDGSDDQIEILIDCALEKGFEPLALVNENMIPAITKVGTLFAEKKYFLPQLLLSAETMEKGFRHLVPALKGTSYANKGKIIMATVEGDIHDIGKNIVALLLRNHGFEVIDLGKDVSAKLIVKKAKEVKPDVIGLSALMTTTMEKMKDVIDLANEEKLKTAFLLGGAVVTEKYARSLGASYARDGIEAVKRVQELAAK
jgi:5-methyltetrahydrofolate--homocysteine methyltransferase